jgi:hypothetical protein
MKGSLAALRLGMTGALSAFERSLARATRGLGMTGGLEKVRQW